MITLTVAGVRKNNEYVLIDNLNITYSVFLEFYECEPLCTNDKITMDARLLDPKFEGYCMPYAFLPDTLNTDKIDLEHIIVNKNGNCVTLKRIYG